MSNLVRAFLGGLVLLLTGSLPGTTGFAQNPPDSENWNDYENYAVSDWGPVSDGLSFRVTTPRELSYGVPITVLVERRVYSDQLPKSFQRWTPDPSKVKFQLDIYDSDDCPGECTWLYSFGKVTSSKRGSLGVDIAKVESTPLTVEFRREPPRKPPKRKSFFDIPPDFPSFPLAAGTHTYRLKLMVDDSVGSCWHGVAETFFRVRVYPRLVVRKRLTIIVPHTLELRNPCELGFTVSLLDTVVVFPELASVGAIRISRYVGMVEITGKFILPTSKLESIVNSGSWPITLGWHTEIKNGVYRGPFTIEVLDAEGANSQELLPGGGRVLWSRNYELPLTPELINALDTCQH